jgi:hypothetical protein
MEVGAEGTEDLERGYGTGAQVVATEPSLKRLGHGVEGASGEDPEQPPLAQGQAT